ncbi:4-hydroxy-tetrahydrodipicolinate reductase [Enterococcus sp. JM4C]|uniref:4-hydroxy-tetrahydrodipicolinate reductase n=1 Tax=Candidatus Enterococcus huntleyi TaxID=1857217 RepID=UPI00137A5D4E|nr:4-hydroxy-tetrahydrodipicolinate reductase [Enterococcus sp. JM4C]KAF1298081.1 4-hydroxy-tetrahydrodipicolinate reductase [Enterococcus sp. JM4C]
MIKIVVAGFNGRMGSTATKMVLENDGFQLVGVLDPLETKKNLRDFVEYGQVDVPVFTDKESLLSCQPDVWIDFTMPEFALEHTQFALEHGIRPVVGTTGFSEADLSFLTNLSREKQVGGLIAPNFAIGAVLMMEFSKKAAKFFPDVEIIELHHDKKLDAPSGTAVKTAEMISEVRTAKKQGHPEEVETIAGARGADYEGLRIHSVRLPGLIAHQQVQFGGEGEGLTIRHDSYDRSSFMGGVALGCEAVMKENELIYGLENLL